MKSKFKKEPNNCCKETFEPDLLLTATAIVFACEAAGAVIFKNRLSQIETILIIRIFEILFMLILLNYIHKAGFKAFGISCKGTARKHLYKGVKTGILWSSVFAVAAILVGIFILCGTGKNPLSFLDSSMPKSSFDIALFIFTGGIISPIAEEFFFRGFLYSYFRQHSVRGGLLVSTVLFALCHIKGSATIIENSVIIVIPLIGGFIFCLSYEYSKSLAAPVIIHLLGNMAIFIINFIN